VTVVCSGRAPAVPAIWPVSDAIVLPSCRVLDLDEVHFGHAAQTLAAFQSNQAAFRAVTGEVWEVRISVGGWG
jgi:hypothetical protein